MVLYFAASCSFGIHVSHAKITKVLVEVIEKATRLDVTNEETTQLSSVHARQIRTMIAKELPAYLTKMQPVQDGMPVVTFVVPGTSDDRASDVPGILQSFCDRPGYKRNVVLALVDLWRMCWACGHFDEGLTASLIPLPDTAPTRDKPTRDKLSLNPTEAAGLLALMGLAPLSYHDFSDILSGELHVGWIRCTDEEYDEMLVAGPDALIFLLEDDGWAKRFNGGIVPTPLAYSMANELRAKAKKFKVAHPNNPYYTVTEQARSS